MRVGTHPRCSLHGLFKFTAELIYGVRSCRIHYMELRLYDPVDWRVGAIGVSLYYERLDILWPLHTEIEICHCHCHVTPAFPHSLFCYCYSGNYISNKIYYCSTYVNIGGYKT